MVIAVGDRLPEASMMRVGANGIEEVSLGELLKGRKVVLFAVPGAFTPTCDSAHVPSFLRVKDKLAAKGIEEIVCLAVNDPFVMKAWGETTGATAGGMSMLSDPAGAFAKAIGMDFEAPLFGTMRRSQRYAMMVEDGVVKILNIEEQSGTCEISGGENMLDKL